MPISISHLLLLIATLPVEAAKFKSVQKSVKFSSAKSAPPPGHIIKHGIKLDLSYKDAKNAKKLTEAVPAKGVHSGDKERRWSLAQSLLDEDLRLALARLQHLGDTQFFLLAKKLLWREDNRAVEDFGSLKEFKPYKDFQDLIKQELVEKEPKVPETKWHHCVSKCFTKKKETTLTLVSATDEYEDDEESSDSYELLVENDYQHNPHHPKVVETCPKKRKDIKPNTKFSVGEVLRRSLIRQFGVSVCHDAVKPWLKDADHRPSKTQSKIESVDNVRKCFEGLNITGTKSIDYPVSPLRNPSTSVAGEYVVVRTKKNPKDEEKTYSDVEEPQIQEVEHALRESLSTIYYWMKLVHNVLKIKMDHPTTERELNIFKFFEDKTKREAWNKYWNEVFSEFENFCVVLFSKHLGWSGSSEDVKKRVQDEILGGVTEFFREEHAGFCVAQRELIKGPAVPSSRMFSSWSKESPVQPLSKTVVGYSDWVEETRKLVDHFLPHHPVFFHHTTIIKEDERRNNLTELMKYTKPKASGTYVIPEDLDQYLMGNLPIPAHLPAGTPHHIENKINGITRRIRKRARRALKRRHKAGELCRCLTSTCSIDRTFLIEYKYDGPGKPEILSENQSCVLFYAQFGPFVRMQKLKHQCLLVEQHLTTLQNECHNYLKEAQEKNKEREELKVKLHGTDGVDRSKAHRQLVNMDGEVQVLVKHINDEILSKRLKHNLQVGDETITIHNTEKETMREQLEKEVILLQGNHSIRKKLEDNYLSELDTRIEELLTDGTPNADERKRAYERAKTLKKKDFYTQVPPPTAKELKDFHVRPIPMDLSPPNRLEGSALPKCIDEIPEYYKDLNQYYKGGIHQNHSIAHAMETIRKSAGKTREQLPDPLQVRLSCLPGEHDRVFYWKCPKNGKVKIGDEECQNGFELFSWWVEDENQPIKDESYLLWKEKIPSDWDESLKAVCGEWFVVIERVSIIKSGKYWGEGDDSKVCTVGNVGKLVYFNRESRIPEKYFFQALVEEQERSTNFHLTNQWAARVAYEGSMKSKKTSSGTNTAAISTAESNSTFKKCPHIEYISALRKYLERPSLGLVSLKRLVCQAQSLARKLEVKKENRGDFTKPLKSMREIKVPDTKGGTLVVKRKKSIALSTTTSKPTPTPSTPRTATVEPTYYWVTLDPKQVQELIQDEDPPKGDDKDEESLITLKSIMENKAALGKQLLLNYREKKTGEDSLTPRGFNLLKKIYLLLTKPLPVIDERCTDPGEILIRVHSKEEKDAIFTPTLLSVLQVYHCPPSLMEPPIKVPEKKGHKGFEEKFEIESENLVRRVTQCYLKLEHLNKIRSTQIQDKLRRNAMCKPRFVTKFCITSFKIPIQYPYFPNPQVKTPNTTLRVYCNWRVTETSKELIPLS